MSLKQPPKPTPIPTINTRWFCRISFTLSTSHPLMMTIKLMETLKPKSFHHSCPILNQHESLWQRHAHPLVFLWITTKVSWSSIVNWTRFASFCNVSASLKRNLKATLCMDNIACVCCFTIRTLEPIGCSFPLPQVGLRPWADWWRHLRNLLSRKDVPPPPGLGSSNPINPPSSTC